MIEDAEILYIIGKLPVVIKLSVSFYLSVVVQMNIILELGLLNEVVVAFVSPLVDRFYCMMTRKHRCPIKVTVINHGIFIPLNVYLKIDMIETYTFIISHLQCI